MTHRLNKPEHPIVERDGMIHHWTRHLAYLQQWFPKSKRHYVHHYDWRRTTLEVLIREIGRSKRLYAYYWWRESLYYWRTSIWNFMVQSKDFIKRCLIQITAPFTYVASIFASQLQRRNEWVLKLPNLVVRIYTWVLVIPAWLFHGFLVFAFFYWGVDASSIGTTDHVSLLEEMRQDINAILHQPESPLWFNAIGLVAIGFLLILAIPLMIALCSVWWGVLGLCVWGSTGIIIWWFHSLFSRILSDRWQNVLFFFLCFIGLLTDGVLSIILGSENFFDSIDDGIKVIHKYYREPMTPSQKIHSVAMYLPNYFTALLLERYILFGFLFWIPVLILCTMARSPLHKVSDWMVQRILSLPRKID